MAFVVGVLGVDCVAGEGRIYTWSVEGACKTPTCLNVIIVVFLKTKIGKDNLWKPERVV